MILLGLIIGYVGLIVGGTGLWKGFQMTGDPQGREGKIIVLIVGSFIVFLIGVFFCEMNVIRFLG